MHNWIKLAVGHMFSSSYRSIIIPDRHLVAQADFVIIASIAERVTEHKHKVHMASILCNAYQQLSRRSHLQVQIIHPTSSLRSSVVI